jgi:hypothetical protein
MRALRGRAALLGSLLAALALYALAGGCAKVSGVLGPDRPPETTIWVTGPVDTVSHTIRVYWDGQDPDGTVSSFEFKWIYAPGAQPAGYDSSLWFSTTARDSLFTLYAPDSVAMPTFEVRAIDNEGMADPTPARQNFSFKNAAPSVRFTLTPPDTTLPVASFGWLGADPDGNINKATYLLWLDGAKNRARLVSSTSFTLTTSDFQNGQGVVEQRKRTAYVTAIDDGGRMSPPDSFAWNVVNPVGTTLLVDESGFTTADNFYRSELNTRLGPGSYTIIDLGTRNPFRTPADVLETFKLFSNVFWYAELNANLSTVLPMAGPPIHDYVSGGGRLYMNSSRFVGTGGALDDAFARDVLGVSGFYINVNTQTTDFTIANTQQVLGAQAPWDTLASATILSGIETFLLNNQGDAMYVAPPGTLDTLHVDNWNIAINRRFGAGRIVFLPFPLRGMNGSFNGHAGHSAIELRKIFDLFGM